MNIFNLSDIILSTLADIDNNEVEEIIVDEPKEKVISKENITPQPLNTPKTVENEPKIDSKQEDDSSFDLETAVVYSEILRPKFKDYEF